ncbi:MAG: hypothetical protein LUG18_03120 [Candidatus Azobacteroides sp.]|nr:hypothetical protein [Candidatus Azobacteroides sp.]
MKKLLNILSLIVLLGAFSSCEDKPDVYEFPKDEYFYDIPDVVVTEDYVIGVPYDVRTYDQAEGVWWNDNTKDGLLYTGTPIEGEYDLRTQPEFLKKQMDWGKQAGIDFFIISWGGHGLNDTILRNYERYYEPGHPQVVIRFDPGYQFGKGVDTLMYNPARMDTIVNDFDSVYNGIMTKNYAYKNKNNGLPVMVLCNFVNQAQTPLLGEFTNLLRNKVNNNVWMMGELAGNWSSPERWGYRDETTKGYHVADTLAYFDAVFITDISTGNKDRYDGYYSLMDYNYRYWQERMKPLGKEYIPMISPAFDNLVNDPSSETYLIPRWNDETNSAYVISGNQPDAPSYNFSEIKKNPYQQFANVAKRNVGDSRIIIVYNWNNYTTGINLEPTVEFGDDYLRYTKEFFKK